MREMRAVAFVTKLIDGGKLDQKDAKRMLMPANAGTEQLAQA
jgi:hypothetical protein